MLTQFLQKAASMVDVGTAPPSSSSSQFGQTLSKIDEKQQSIPRPTPPKRAATLGRLNLVESDLFSPQRAEFIWLKLICATRDVGDEANMASMNEKQWQIGLNQYRINIEPGLSRQVFSMVLHRKGKLLFRSDFIKFVERQLVNNRDEFDRRVDMTAIELGAVQKDDEDELVATLAAKIIHALLGGTALDVFELMKGSFVIDKSASIEDLLLQMDELEWHHRIEIMEHIANSERHLSQTDVSLLLDKWALQLSDERSQLVRVALDTCPLLVERMVLTGMRVDVSALLDGLVFPIRAKRSKELQRLGAEAGERLMSVFLNHFHVSDDEFSVTSSSAMSDTPPENMDPLNCVIQSLCAKILENDKYEIVRKQFLSYIIQLIVYYKESADASRIFDDEETTGRIAATLNVTLNDKKPEVREESFRMMRLLDKMFTVNPFDDVKHGIEHNILEHIDPAARLRFERKKSRAKRSRSTQIRPSQISRLRRQRSDPTDSTEAPERPKVKLNKRSNSVPQNTATFPL